MCLFYGSLLRIICKIQVVGRDEAFLSISLTHCLCILKITLRAKQAKYGQSEVFNEIKWAL